MPKKPAVKKSEPKKKTTSNKVIEPTVAPITTGVIEGNYTKTVYENGEKISFEIDWDRLKEYMRTV